MECCWLCLIRDNGALEVSLQARGETRGFCALVTRQITSPTSSAPKRSRRDRVLLPRPAIHIACHRRIITPTMTSGNTNTPTIIAARKIRSRYRNDLRQEGDGYSHAHGSISSLCAFASRALAVCRTTNPDVLLFRICRILRCLCRPSERKVAAGRCRKQAPRIVLP